MSVDVACKQCGQLAYFNYDMHYEKINKIVANHKQTNGKTHRVIVKRLS